MSLWAWVMEQGLRWMVNSPQLDNNKTAGCGEA